MIVFRYPRHISLFSNTFLKPSKVMSTGHNHILPVLTAPGSLIEALTTNTSGYKITITRIATSVLLIRSKDLSERPCFFMLSTPYHKLFSLVFLAIWLFVTNRMILITEDR